MSVATRRLKKEHLKLLKEPAAPGIECQPNPQNMLEWFYVLTPSE